MLGARYKYFPDTKTPSNARTSTHLVQLLPLCHVDAGKVEMLKNIAYATPIHNELADWSCQDFVLEVLVKIEEARIINRYDADYRRNKAAIAAKRESWP